TGAAAALAALAVLLCAGARAQETNLIFATVNPPNAHLSVNILVPWAQKVNEAGKGVVKLDIRDGLTLANLGNAYDRVLSAAIQRGTVDGIMTGWTAFQPFKFAEVTSHHIDVRLGASTGMVFMSRKKWDALPPAVKKVLESASGEATSRAFGAFWDRISEEGR